MLLSRSLSLSTLATSPAARWTLAACALASLLLLFASVASDYGPPRLFRAAPPPARPAFQPGSHVGEPSSQALQAWVKPAGLRIVGLVFYGRAEFVKVLDCYLKRNLVDNGGLLDEVIFSVHTDKQPDLDYLDELLATTPRYTRFESTEPYEGFSFVGTWGAVKRGNLYIKIDDDVLYFEDDAIAALSKRMIENPQYFAVSANSVNNPALSWIHYGLGVYEPYLPELTPPPNPSHQPQSWRASELPHWTGPPSFIFNGSQPAPFPGHRWLPLPHRTFNTPHASPPGRDISDTPAGALTYDAFGPSWRDWAVAAQTHYSFLHHLERGELWRYKFNLWDYHYYRLSINFIAFWGDDIVDAMPFPTGDDEEYLTRAKPRELGRHVVVDGTAISVHFAFSPQRKLDDADAPGGLYHTDLLARYKAYAEEEVCPHPRRPGSKAKAKGKGAFW
ncbi:hypothetical protein EJ06DRAFT_144184 [Trichodelitschia bisporula]|uniref:Uncharacterized protein n=1 Tax=Trichodelitschia bisporula TaxID=703511 RepID=A0A6G1HNA5_9PEZI|nr:hypothetical protein EJ06DRAFT_144184 [Trichodelitschia bisporula]